jgi:hypothetical protein
MLHCHPMYQSVRRNIPEHLDGLQAVVRTLNVRRRFVSDTVGLSDRKCGLRAHGIMCLTIIIDADFQEKTVMK